MIEYLKSARDAAKEEAKADRASLATKEGISEIKRLIMEQVAALRIEIATSRTETERGLKEQLKWLIVLLMGFSSLIITVIKLL